MKVAFRACQFATGPGWSLAALTVARPWLELTMARHMGIELPILFLLGCFAARCTEDVLALHPSVWNANGIPGLLFAFAATSFWMIPAALDAAVLHPAVAVAKAASLLGGGFLAGLSWRPAGIVIQGFFVLNWCWMTVFTGLLYRQAPRQLCSVYLADQQSDAGTMLVVWALAGLAWWVWRVVSKELRMEP